MKKLLKHNSFINNELARVFSNGGHQEMFPNDNFGFNPNYALENEKGGDH